MHSMKFYNLLVLIPVLAFAFTATSVQAETVLRISDSVSVSDDQTVDGDFYGAGQKVSLSGTIAGDAHIAAGTISSNGTIEEDLFALGGTVQMYASVTDDVRIVAGEATIAEHVGGDVFVLGGVLTVLSSAQIDGDIFFYGSEAEINGAVGGSIHGHTNKMRIDAPVGGDVEMQVEDSLILGDRADIAGSVQYKARTDLVRAQNAVVVGDISRNDPTNSDTPTNPREALVPFLMYAFSVLVVFVLLRNRLGVMMTEVSGSFTKNGLIGLAACFLLPFVVMLSLLTVIGMLVGFAAFFAVGFLCFTVSLLIPIFIGVLLNKSFTKSNQVTLLWTLLGIVSVEILLTIPVVGALIVFALFAAILGSLLRNIYRMLAA